MKTKIIRLSVLILMFLTVSNQIAIAQEKRLDSSPQAFHAFFNKFKTAVRKNDRTAIVSMTRFPFKYGFDAGDEGTIKSKTEFLKKFDEIFGSSPKEFLAEKNPLFSRVAAGSFVVSTEDAAHLTFVKNGSGFMFSAYMVEP